jgi:hypothetical protein
MSQVIAYHDKKLAIVCADDQVSDLALGQRIGGAPKFVILPSGPIFCASGRASVSEKLLWIVRRVDTQEGLISKGHERLNGKFQEWPPFLEYLLRQQWAQRQPAPAIPEDKDNLAAMLLGFDPEEDRVRVFYWFSKNDFQTFEASANPLSRILCDGFWTPEEDGADLQELTNLMTVADNKGPGWIAAQLRRTFNLIRQRHIAVIGLPIHFGAIDRHGIVSLPAEFPAPAPQEYAWARQAVGHCATINVASFDMVVPGLKNNGAFVQYNPGSIPGLAYNTLYYVSMDDPALRGGNVTYQVHTTREKALEELGFMFVGSIITPVQGAADTKGNNDGGAGAQVGEYAPIGLVPTITVQQASATITNLSNAGKADITSPTSLRAVGQASGVQPSQAQVIWKVPNGVSFSKAVLNVVYGISTDNPSPGFASLNIGYSFDGGSTFNFAYVFGSSRELVAPTSFLIPVPPGVSAGNIQVAATVTVGISSTSGAAQLDVYQMWLQVL